MSFRKNDQVMEFIEGLLAQKNSLQFSNNRRYTSSEIKTEIDKGTTKGREFYQHFAEFYKRNER